VDSRNVRNLLKTIQQKLGCIVIGAARCFYFPESVGQMGKSFKDNDWADRDEQLNPDFFDASAPVFVEETAASELSISVSETRKEEVTEEQTVSVRFTSEGYAEEVSEDDEPRQTDLLEPMLLPRKVAASEWGSAFAEIHARVENLGTHSKVTATRYIQSGSTKKISCLPSVVDFLADVQIVARKVLSPTLYRVWQKVYYEGFGKSADRVPESVQMAIQLRCGTAWKKAGLLPFRKYWKVRTESHKLCAASLELVADVGSARNKRRRERRAAKRADKITTWSAAA